MIRCRADPAPADQESPVIPGERKHRCPDRLRTRHDTMTIDTNDLLNSILASLSRIDYIRPGEIPNIDLYMDQITTFMDTQLASTKRYDEDKILTKTMINNYTKNNLLPPPIKKKYTKEHVLLLVFIYYFKSFLSIKDIGTILQPMMDKYCSPDSQLDLSQLYEEICKMEKGRISEVQEGVRKAYQTSTEAFAELEDGEEKEDLQRFAFLCNLSFDVYLKKMIIEKVIDDLSSGD